jgi:CheY-like chemotaxis protein
MDMARILVVDDSVILQRITAMTLNRVGHTVVGASDGPEAVAYLEHNEVDLIIVDLAMPGMDGLTLVRNLRADPRFQRLPILVLTASGLEQDRLKAEAIGVDAFMNKPASSQELISATSQLLARQ